MTLCVLLPIAIAILPLLAGAAALMVAGNRQSGSRSVPALLFHAVPACRIPGLSHTTADTCSGLLRYLSDNGFCTLTVAEACARRITNGAERCKAVVLTFDDAFEDFYAGVYPLLSNYRMRATIFPIVRYLGRQSSWDIYPARTHMSTAQIREIADAGHEIGSHTMSHPNLVFLPDSEVEKELRQSKQSLEDALSRTITTLSFPYGCWNRRVWEIAKSCGYAHASVYGSRAPADRHFVHVEGVYAFDTLDDLIEKTQQSRRLSNSLARSRIMPHFAKGTPLWRFRKNYRLITL
jgi:peptidoglycan/xylan/chitin deacetylase (PgdA/CDA1 family)